jgi:serine/threonine protein kinase
VKSHYEDLTKQNGGKLSYSAISMLKRIKMVWQLCLAVMNMHGCRILHQDLKPENIMLDTDYNVLLTDLSSTKNQDNTDICTWAWVNSNESDKRFSTKIEVYYFALCAYYLLKGKPLIKKEYLA